METLGFRNLQRSLVKFNFVSIPIIQSTTTAVSNPDYRRCLGIDTEKTSLSVYIFRTMTVRMSAGSS